MKLIAPYSVEGIENSTLDEFNDFIQGADYFGIDSETNGLDPHSKDLIMLQVGNETEQYILDMRHLPKKEVGKMLSINYSVKIGVNLTFDYKFFLKHLDLRMSNMFDCRIAERILENGRVGYMQISLKSLAEKYLSLTMEKDTRLEFTRIGNQPFNYRQIRYGALDVSNPCKIYHKQLKRLEEEELLKTNSLEQRYNAVTAEMEYSGMYVDVKKWEELYIQNQLGYEQAEKEIYNYLIKNNVRPFVGSLDLFTNKPKVNINLSSPKQVALLFKVLGIPHKVLDKDKTRELKDKYDIEQEIYKNATGATELERYEEIYPFLKIFLRYKKYQKATSTYGIEWLKNINKVTGRVHGNCNPLQNTGRIAIFGPNLQQVPSVKSKEPTSAELHRTCFMSPIGRKLVVRDYSNQEIRYIGHLAQEESIIEEYLTGSEDIHSLTASRVFSSIRGTEVKVSKKQNADLRNMIKPVVFGSLYGIGPGKLSKNLKITQDEAEEILDTFYKVYSGLDDYFKECHRLVKQRGYIIIDSVTNRKFYFKEFDHYKLLVEKINKFKKYQEVCRDRGIEPKFKLKSQIWSEYYTIKGKMERNSQNYPIQGGCASMTKAALIMLYDWMVEKDLFHKISIVLALHDEIVLEVDEDIAVKANSKLDEFMVKAGQIFCPSIPMKSSGGITDVWDH